jgi:hypothetical protein
MRQVLSTLCLVLLLADVSTAAIGQFEGQTDVGEILIAGSADFNADTNEYRITASGANM